MTLSRPGKYLLSFVLTTICFLSTPVCLSAENPAFAELIDLDASIGFSKPRSITVLRSFDRAKNVFFILPGTVEFIMPTDQASRIGLQANIALKGKHGAGSFTFTVAPKVSSEDFDEAIEELKKRFPDALFAYPLPTKAELSLTSIEQPKILFTGANDSTQLTNTISFTIKLTPIETRFLLLPQSLYSPSASFHYVYTIRGIERDPDGNPKIVERSFRLGGILSGFCAPYPDSTINLPASKTGCALAKFDRKLVREIQKLLKKSGEYDGIVDGDFGPRTDRAIRAFQKRSGLFVSGYPTLELLDGIKKTIKTT